MRLIKSVSIFTTEGNFTLNESDYDEIRDESQEFPDHTEFTIGLLKNGEIVRRFWNPTCDITYKE